MRRGLKLIGGGPILMAGDSNSTVRDNRGSVHTHYRDVLRRLEKAARGDDELDLALHLATGRSGELNDISLRLLAEGLAASALRDIFSYQVPPYTQTLDAGLPDENVVATVYVEERGKWAAVHRATQGTDFVAWGATEPLARRAAAFKALVEDAPEQDCDQTADDQRPWTVSF